MKELKLIDRVVVEVRGEYGFNNNAEFIAEQLRDIAREIEEQGVKGSEILGKKENIAYEILWEHESVEYGGFKIVGDKSLISQYYYHSEPAPRIISEELADDIRKFNMDYENNEQEVGEDIETKTDYLCDAVNLLAKVEQETKIVL